MELPPASSPSPPNTANGHTNGQTNGHSNGYRNGHHSNGHYANGHASAPEPAVPWWACLCVGRPAPARVYGACAVNSDPRYSGASAPPRPSDSSPPYLPPSSSGHNTVPNLATIGSNGHNNSGHNTNGHNNSGQAVR